MKLVRRIMIILLVSVACVGCDQGTKSLASHYLPKSEMRSYFFDSVRISYTENTGVFLGLGSLLPQNSRFWLFTVFVGLFLVSLFVYLLYNSNLNLSSVAGLSLIFAGGGSNLYDRIVNEGAVIDFLNVGVGSIRTGVFNVADMAIMLGTALVLLVHSKFRHRP